MLANTCSEHRDVGRRNGLSTIMSTVEHGSQLLPQEVREKEIPNTLTAQHICCLLNLLGKYKLRMSGPLKYMLSITVGHGTALYMATCSMST